jgi:hypothetical protein
MFVVEERCDQKSTLHLNLGSLSGGPKFRSKGTFTIPSSSSSQSRDMLKPLLDRSCRALAAMSSSEGGNRILASTRGAETKRELSRARGETRSWRQFREDISDELRGSRCLV